MEYKWIISALNCAVESEGLPNVINVIHWRYNATKVEGDKTYFAETYGAVNVSQPNPQNFIPYEDVTEQEVIAWLEQILPVEAMQSSLEANINLQINPIEVTLPLPWAASQLNLVITGDYVEEKEFNISVSSNGGLIVDEPITDTE